MNKVVRGFVALSFLSILLTGCNKSKRNKDKKEFTTHELEYGGDTEEVSYSEFCQLYRSTYFQNNHQYRNTYVKMTSDKSFYGKADPTDYFKNFTELRFVGVLNDENREFAMLKPFYLMPVNFEAKYFSPDSISQYEIGWPYMLLNIYMPYFNNQSSGPTGYSFQKYKFTIDDATYYFSKDYYLTSVDYKVINYSIDGEIIKERSVHFSFSYFNIDDLPILSGSVDRETFFIHLVARSNQKINFNALHVTMKLENAVIGMHEIVEDVEGYGTYIINELEYGEGQIDAYYQRQDILDKTAFRVYRQINDQAFEYKEKEFSNNLTNDQKEFIQTRYFKNGIMNIDCLFFSTELWSLINYNCYIENEFEQEYTTSPLSAKLKEKFYDKNGQNNGSRTYQFNFNNDGLIQKMVKNDEDIIDGEIKVSSVTAGFEYSLI